MKFTRRTYREAIRRSIHKEHELRTDARFFMGGKSPWRWDAVHSQINHTRRLQARKRKERK